MAEFHNLNVTDASNTDRFPENMAPSGINDGARALEGLAARWYFDTNYSVISTLSGSVIQMTLNRTSITLTGTTSNYIADLLVAFTVGSSDVSGPCSVRLNDIQTLSLRDSQGVSLSGTALPSGTRACIVKDGTNNYFRLLSPEINPKSGTWTPVLTCETPGNLSIAYSLQSGRYIRHGNLVTVWFGITTSTFTHTTASGAVSITGLPFTSITGIAFAGTMEWSGITKAGYTDVIPQVQQGVTTMRIRCAGSGQGSNNIEIADMPAGGTVILNGSVTYNV